MGKNEHTNKRFTDDDFWEVGCYPGFKLIFLNKHFGYSVYGAPYLMYVGKRK